MLVLPFFSWWYGAGWKQLIDNTEKRLRRVSNMFSVPILLRTLFAPWKRIVSYRRPGLEGYFNAAIDNLISRTIGFLVRVLVLISALVMLVIVALLAAAELILWPLLPVAVVALIILGAAA